YDEDHVSGFEDLSQHVFVKCLVRNATVSATQIRQLKSEDRMGRGIDALVHSIDHHFTGGPPSILDDIDFGDTSFRTYGNIYAGAPFGFDDENNLSLVIFITC